VSTKEIIMKHLKAMTCAALAFLLAVGCGAGDDSALEGPAPGGPSAVEAEAAEGAELARVEFEDGNVVRFEALSGGVLITELGSEENPRHFQPKEGLTALEAFRTLAPEHEVPEALLRAHERMYPADVTIAPPASETDTTPSSEELPLDPDLEHNGEFQQSLPSATFLANMCNFPTGSGSYKHPNRTDVHVDTSMNVHTAYYAVGADIGIIKSRACAGKNTGGIFKGNCSTWTTTNPGGVASAYYDAGIACPDDPNWLCELFGCPKICELRKVRLDIWHDKISNSVRFHDCVAVNR
jgi:hypothetical protein